METTSNQTYLDQRKKATAGQSVVSNSTGGSADTSKPAGTSGANALSALTSLPALGALGAATLALLI